METSLRRDRPYRVLAPCSRLRTALRSHGHDLFGSVPRDLTKLQDKPTP